MLKSHITLLLLLFATSVYSQSFKEVLDSLRTELSIPKMEDAAQQKLKIYIKSLMIKNPATNVDTIINRNMQLAMVKFMDIEPFTSNIVEKYDEDAALDLLEWLKVDCVKEYIQFRIDVFTGERKIPTRGIDYNDQLRQAWIKQICANLDLTNRIFGVISLNYEFILKSLPEEMDNKRIATLRTMKKMKEKIIKESPREETAILNNFQPDKMEKIVEFSSSKGAEFFMEFYYGGQKFLYTSYYEFAYKKLSGS